MYDYKQFTSDIFKMTGIDLASYKERQMKRRIEALISRHKLDGYQAFVGAIQKDKELYEHFLSYLTINVSEFYRNKEQWDLLEKDVLPKLMKDSGGKKLKIWSAACSTGDEPYSLVMLLSKFMPLRDIRIDATDIDKQILEKAQLGIYDDKSIKALPKEFVTKYFTKLGEHSFKISDDIKRCVSFKQHNLLKDTYGSGYDLIVCRNVMIYFTEDAKQVMYEKFNKALRSGGVLFVGSTEQMIHADKIGFKAAHSFFYEKA